MRLALRDVVSLGACFIVRVRVLCDFARAELAVGGVVLADLFFGRHDASAGAPANAHVAFHLGAACRLACFDAIFQYAHAAFEIAFHGGFEGAYVVVETACVDGGNYLVDDFADAFVIVCVQG